MTGKQTIEDGPIRIRAKWSKDGEITVDYREEWLSDRNPLEDCLESYTKYIKRWYGDDIKDIEYTWKYIKDSPLLPLL